MSDDRKNHLRLIDQMEARELAERQALEQHKSGGGGGGGNDITLEEIETCLNANEMGDGELYRHHNKDKFVFVANEGNWLEWTGHHWKEDRKNRSITAAESVALSYRKLLDAEDDEGKRKNIKRRINKIRSLGGAEKARAWSSMSLNDPLVIEGEELDSNPMVLGCPNGVVLLDKDNCGKFRPGEPSDYIKTTVPTPWMGIDAKCPAWEHFLSEITGANEELVDFLHRLCGYGITGLTVEHVLPLVRGRGRNGKGAFVDVLTSVLGDVAGPIGAEMLLDQGKGKSSAGPSPDIMALRGRRMVFASETDEGARFSASRVKWFTGGDELIGRNPHDKFLSRFRPSHLLWLFTNRPPFATPTDYAFFERCAVIKFPFSFVQGREPKHELERRADLFQAEKLRKEASGILAWLVRGCQKWHQDGLNKPQCVLDETERYRQMLDYFNGFVDCCCYTGDDLEIAATDLYKTFKQWYVKVIKPERNERTPSQTAFFKKASAHFEKIKKDGGRMFYQGIALAPPDDDDPEMDAGETSIMGQAGFRFGDPDPERA